MPDAAALANRSSFFRVKGMVFVELALAVVILAPVLFLALAVFDRTRRANALRNFMNETVAGIDFRSLRFGGGMSDYFLRGANPDFEAYLDSKAAEIEHDLIDRVNPVAYRIQLGQATFRVHEQSGFIVGIFDREPSQGPDNNWAYRKIIESSELSDTFGPAKLDTALRNVYCPRPENGVCDGRYTGNDHGPSLFAIPSPIRGDRLMAHHGYSWVFGGHGAEPDDGLPDTNRYPYSEYLRATVVLGLTVQAQFADDYLADLVPGSAMEPSTVNFWSDQRLFSPRMDF